MKPLAETNFTKMPKDRRLSGLEISSCKDTDAGYSNKLRNFNQRIPG